MINFTGKDRYGFEDLVRLIALLRAPDGCPWDSVQTHLSVRRNFLEEAYEACEGFDRDDPALMCEELGDVLMQVVFHTDMERAAGRFTIEDVCDGVCKKLIFRHPALFGGEAGLSWEELKQREKGQKSTAEALDGVARSLPALIRSEKLLKKAAAASPTESPEESLGKLEQEAASLRARADTSAHAEQAVGELLMASVNAALCLGVDPEQALQDACERFVARFAAREQAAKQP